MKANKHNKPEEDSIDTIALIKKVWIERRFIIKTSITFFLIGCLIAILSPIEYTSQTTFVPQVSVDEIQSNSNRRLGSLASLAGLNIAPNEVTADSYLSPLLYEKIVDSEEFSLELLKAEIINLDGDKFSISEYLLSKESSLKFNPIGLIKDYTIGLFLNTDADKINTDIIKNYNFISEEDYYLLNLFRQKFTIELNEMEGYIKVLAKDEDAFISSQLVKQITRMLQTKIIEIRTNKIKERLEFSKEQYELKQVEFDILQKKRAEFKDSNKSISTARFLSELEKLDSEYQLQQNILVNLASEFNNNKIKLNKDTPIFSVIDEVSVPNVISKPKRSLLIVICVFLGLILSIGFVLVKEPFNDLIKEIID